MKKASYDYFDRFRFDGNYAVKQYDRYGKGQAVVYCDTLEEAKNQRTQHAKLIGLEPEPTYKDFAYYPTIWQWVEEDADSPFESSYDRVMGY